MKEMQLQVFYKEDVKKNAHILQHEYIIKKKYNSDKKLIKTEQKC